MLRMDDRMDQLVLSGCLHIISLTKKRGEKIVGGIANEGDMVVAWLEGLEHANGLWCTIVLV